MSNLQQALAEANRLRDTFRKTVTIIETSTGYNFLFLDANECAAYLRRERLNWTQVATYDARYAR